MKRALIVGAGAVAVLALGGAAGYTSRDALPIYPGAEQARTAELAPGQYQGICAVVTPPDPDPCDAVNGTLRYSALGALERSTYHPKWLAANPGEVARLSTVMAAPGCSVPSSPQPQLMLTNYGAGMVEIMRAIACARHPEPIAWPPLPPPLDPARTDKTAPSAPGPIIVSP